MIRVRVLDRKLRRDLRTAIGRLLAITGIMGLGVACYVEMASVYENLIRAKDRFYAQCRMADFSVELKKVPNTVLMELADFPEILEVRPRIQFSATVDLPGVAKLLNAQVLSLPNRQSPVINDIVLVSGSYFTDRRENEVILHDTFARRRGLKPGDWIHVILNNRRQELFIVGTAMSSEFVYLVGPGSLAPDPENFGVLYLKQRFAEEVFDFDGASNQVVGTMIPSAREHPQPVLDRIEAHLASYGVFSTTPRKHQASNRYLSEELEGIATFSGILPTIFLAVAALVLNILMVRWTDQQRTIVGTLKALGYTNPQVFAHYMKFGMSVGLLAGVAGCIGGYFLAGWLTSVYGQFYEFPDLRNELYLDKVGTGLLISLVCASLGALHGARSVLKLQPAEAMRPKPPRQGGAILLERIPWLWSQLSFSTRLALRNIFRNRFRTIAGAFATAMGTCILVTGFMMQEAIHYLVDFQFEKVQRSDVDLHLKDEQGYDALLEASRLPGVDYAEPLLEVSCTFYHGPYQYRGAISGIAPDARLTIPRDDKARAIRIPTSGLVMSRKMAELLHVKTNDTVVVRPTEGLRQPQEVRVVSIADGYLGLGVYADLNYLNRLIGEAYAINAIQLQIDPRPEVKLVLNRELKELPALQSVHYRADTVNNLRTTVIETQSIFIGVLVFFAGVIFFCSVLNSSLVSLAERQGEVATFRVLGYTPWEVGNLFLKESLVVTAIGTLLGMPMGYWLGVWLTILYDTELFRIPVVTTPTVWISTVVCSILFTLSAHALVQWSIYRMDWLDALKVRE